MRLGKVGTKKEANIKEAIYKKLYIVYKNGKMQK